VNIILDTDVMIDLLRNNSTARQWLGSLNGFPSISCFTALELLGGSQNKHEYRTVEKFLLDFPILYPSLEDLDKAIGIYSPFCLSHGVGYLDLLIASVAVGHGLALATFNKKHFSNLPNLQIVQPYIRQ
jgi:predicted nucleic acid-binding protein